MKTLMILRHGKSDWTAPYAEDHDRPLAPRGVSAAELIGSFVATSGETPQSVLSSTALRACRTAELAVRAGAWDCGVTLDRALYAASVPQVLDLIRQQDESVHRLLLVGHQPTSSALVAGLTGGLSVRFPTAALACIDLAVDRWSEVEPQAGTLRWLVTPKLLRKAGFRG